MAIVTFNVAIDMRTFAGYDFSAQFPLDDYSTAVTSTSWVLRSGTGYFDRFAGTGFADFTTALPDFGTVTSWQFGYTEELANPANPYNPTPVDITYWTVTGISQPSDDVSPWLDDFGGSVAILMSDLLTGNDTVNGSGFDDYLLGYAGNDLLKGNDGNDTLDGGAGSDLLNGGAGKDVMIGGVGADTFIVDNSGDKVVEDASGGTDLIKTSVGYTLPANVENLTLIGSSAINGHGNALANVITGNDAANQLSGGLGNDSLHGEGGNDTLAGGGGADTLEGGAGADEFLFNTVLNSYNHDSITDFSVGTDTIALDQTIFTAFAATGALASSAFAAGTSASDSDTRIIYDSVSGNIYYDPDGNGAHAQLLFAHVTPGTALTSADFLIVS